MQFEIDGVKLFYEVRGNQNSDVAIAFFNGVMATTNSWYGMLDGFERLGFKIVLHDFMGQMKSDKPQRCIPLKSIAVRQKLCLTVSTSKRCT